MIALPGLLLTTGRFSEAKAVLKSFAESMVDGVLPNDLGARSYNTVDASLWFIRAVWSYYQSSGDLDFVERLWPGLLEVVNRYSHPGKDFGRDGDGLIVVGFYLDGCQSGWTAGYTEGREVLRDKCTMVLCTGQDGSSSECPGRARGFWSFQKVERKFGKATTSFGTANRVASMTL